MQDEDYRTDSDYQVEGGVGGDFLDDWDETTSVDDGTLPPDRYLDRELSWLHFNQRVLELAEDPAVPLLERVNFLAIFASNLDEFFMVRVAGLKRRIVTGLAVPTNIGRAPGDVLADINRTALELQHRHANAFHEFVKPELDDANIHIEAWADLNDDDRAQVDQTFSQQIFPVLMPLAVDPAHPFPYISGLSLNLAVLVRNPTSGKEHFARVKVPPIINRWMQVGPQRFVPIEDVMAAHLPLLFPGMEILANHTFRVTRNEDLEVEEDDAENLLKALEQELLRRKFGPPVRLEVENSIAPDVLELLMDELGVHAQEVVHLDGPLDLRSLNEIADIDRPELQFDPFVPGTHSHLAEVETSSPADLFSALRKRDVLVHHPYDSFATSVQRFIEQAAADPKVLAIKQTLYRTSGDSPIIDSLIDAARAGKQVLVLVEIKARFDEQANIRWARKLERAGCHVVYGIVGLKTHCKLALVLRDEPDGLRRYAHIGTGNYNPKTARMYEDIGLLTANPEITHDLTELFNNLSGFSQQTDYRKLLVAPARLRDGLVERIRGEIAHHRAGREAHIRIKVNSLVDERIIDALYEASMAGVPVDVVVRGICAIRPGVPGLSENVRAVSVLGRFLEHSRVYWFAGGGTPEAWIGSADLMHRNLDRRVEVLVDVPSAQHVEHLGEILATASDPDTSSWRLDTKGQWHRHVGTCDLQGWLIDRARRRRFRAAS